MPVPTLVLNFGHSVLRSLTDYTEAASEIYRHYRTGHNIVAVTSAQGDQTDVLMAEARRIGPEGISDGGGALGPRDWLRVSPGSATALTAGPDGARLWVKTGHLRQMTAS